MIRLHTTTPLAVGEIFNTIWDCERLISEQLIDYISVTSVHAGGVNALRRMLNFASVYHVRSPCHGPMDVSPVAVGANVHVDRWSPNFGIREYSGYTDATHEMFPHAWRQTGGYPLSGETIGHGVDIDETVAEKNSYVPAYLPVTSVKVVEFPV